MIMYFTPEFTEDLKFPMLPIKGFKFQLIRFTDRDFKVTADKVTQSMSFQSISSPRDSLIINSGPNTEVIFELPDDPNAKSSNLFEDPYYDGAIASYMDVRGINQVAFLLLEETNRVMVDGINHLTINGWNVNHLPYSDESSDQVTLTSALKSGSYIHNLNELLTNGMNSLTYPSKGLTHNLLITTLKSH